MEARTEAAHPVTALRQLRVVAATVGGGGDAAAAAGSGGGEGGKKPAAWKKSEACMGELVLRVLNKRFKASGGSVRS